MKTIIASTNLPNENNKNNKKYPINETITKSPNPPEVLYLSNTKSPNDNKDMSNSCGINTNNKNKKKSPINNNEISTLHEITTNKKSPNPPKVLISSNMNSSDDNYIN